MNSTQLQHLIKGYSSEKLLDIIGPGASSYNEMFLDYAKDELVKRNVKFELDNGNVKEVAALSDEELKNIIEIDSEDYHLEYLEIARNEYLRRGFKNDIKDDLPETEATIDKYAALKNISNGLVIIGWFWMVLAVLLLIVPLIANVGIFSLISYYVIIPYALICVFNGLLSMAFSEILKFLMRTEEKRSL